MGEEDEKARHYRIVAEKQAAEIMKAVVKDLLEGDKSSCEADERIISVKELLTIESYKGPSFNYSARWLASIPEVY